MGCVWCVSLVCCVITVDVYYAPIRHHSVGRGCCWLNASKSRAAIVRQCLSHNALPLWPICMLYNNIYILAVRSLWCVLSLSQESQPWSQLLCFTRASMSLKSDHHQPWGYCQVKSQLGRFTQQTIIFVSLLCLWPPTPFKFDPNTCLLYQQGS